MAFKFSRLRRIENVWAILKQRVEKQAVRSLADLTTVVQDEWKSIEMATINKTIATIDERISQVIDRRGKKCDY